MSFQRMQDEDERLRKLIQGIITEAEEVDRAEDEAERRGELPVVPEEFCNPVTRRAKIQEAMKALRAEAKATKAQERQEKAAEKRKPEKAKDEDPEQPKLPLHRVQAYADGTPKPTAQRNFTDPESRIMKTSTQGFIRGCTTPRSPSPTATRSSLPRCVAGHGTTSPRSRRCAES